jgi:AraC-like DNA-binding protein
MQYLISKNDSPLIHVSSGELVSQGGFTHPGRIIDTFVIIIIIKGELYIAQDGVPFTLKENQFIILLSDHKHYGWKASESELSYYWCHFSIKDDYYRIVSKEKIEEFFDGKQFSPAYSGEEDSCLEDEHFSQFFILPEHGNLLPNGRAALIFRQLLDIARSKTYSPNLPNYALSLLAMEVSQEYIEEAVFRNRNRELNPNLEKIIEWLRVNYNQELYLEKIADIFEYNSDYLSTAFRKYTGHPLMKYIAILRTSAAKKLLANTKLGVKEIAFKCGFVDEKNFLKRFKQLEGITPTMYRNAFHRTKIVQ